MKYSIVFLSIALCLAGCGMRNLSENKLSEELPRPAVTLTHGVYGHIERTTTFPATTVYQNKSVVSAPIPGFIAEMSVTAGMRVKAGQLLYKLESKERHAIGGAGDDGIIPIRVTRDGIVLDVQQQTGNYVAEGAALCTIVESESLIFEINVPGERRKEVRNGDKCTLELPDGTSLPAIVRQTLVSMNTVSQSERVIASANAPFLPEGLRVNAVFSVSPRTDKKGMILPESAVQSDETLSRHWVMKLGGDSTAVKVPVEIVGSNSSEIEVLSDSLSPQDGIILTGGYGLESGSKVAVVKEEAAL